MSTPVEQDASRDSSLATGRWQWPFAERIRDRRQLVTYSALGLAIGGWASLHPVAKGVVSVVGALQTTWSRTTVAAILLIALALVVRGPSVLLRELVRHPEQLAIYAVLSFTLSSLMAMAALRVLPAGINAVLNNMGPLYLAIVTAISGHRARAGMIVLGALLAFAGVGLVVLPGTAADHLNLLAVGISGSSSIVIAIQAVYGRWMLDGRDPLVATAISAGMAAIGLSVFLPFFGGLLPVIEAPHPVQMALLYLGTGATALNFVCWSIALQRLSAPRAMLFQNFIPPLGVLLSVIFLGEALTPWLSFGVALIVGGTMLAQRSLPGRRRQAASPSPERSLLT
ncbi:MAG: EamA family transporter [Chloroflexi bacterium]|nr:EamA family transporter [Chloroflexota bacterium]